MAIKKFGTLGVVLYSAYLCIFTERFNPQSARNGGDLVLCSGVLVVTLLYSVEIPADYIRRRATDMKIQLIEDAGDKTMHELEKR